MDIGGVIIALSYIVVRARQILLCVAEVVDIIRLTHIQHNDDMAGRTVSPISGLC